MDRQSSKRELKTQILRKDHQRNFKILSRTAGLDMRCLSARVSTGDKRHQKIFSIKQINDNLIVDKILPYL